MTTQRTVLVIPGSGGCWHVPHQLFAADAARMRGAQMHYVSWTGEVPPEPEARGPWAVEQITAALRGLPKPLIIAYSEAILKHNAAYPTFGRHAGASAADHACATAAQHHVYQVREPGTRTVRTVWPRLRGW